MTPRSRTLLGIALFLPLAAVLLATFACLPAPVGDPDASRLDDTLTGAWQGVPKSPDNKDVGLALLQPWDARTYLVRYFAIEQKDGKEDRNMALFKGWLTTLGNATFLTAQPMDGLQFGPAGEGPVKRYWVVMRIDRNAAAGTLEMRMVSPESEVLKGKETREAIEAAIKANPDDKSLYAESLTFKKLPKDEQLKLEDTLNKFGIDLP